jgi:PhnB protein
MLNCTPFLLFDGNCAEAMKFYSSCLGGELTLTKLGDTPMKDQFPPDKYNKIINAHLKSEGIEISATDWLATTPKWKQGNSIGLFIIGGDYNEMRAIFDKLSVGSKKNTFVDLKDMPFGIYGHFYDKYGVSWFFKGDK